MLAVPTALLPVWVVTRASAPALPFVVPWPSLVALVIVIPALIGALALVGGAITSRWRPTTAAGFAAE